MKTATVSDFRTNMKKHLADVERDQDVLILSASRKRDYVVITLEQYNSMEETAHLLSTRANTERLMEGIAQHQNGKIAHTFKIDSNSKVAAGKAKPKAASAKRKA